MRCNLHDLLLGSPDTITLKLVNIPEKDTKHEEQSDL